MPGRADYPRTLPLLDFLLNDRVIIAGAGPVGLTLALLLAQRGIAVTVLEAEPELRPDYRASTFHPPTLDMLEESGISAGLLEMGLVCPTFQYRDRKLGKIAEFDLSLLKNDTRHPYRLQCEQFKLAAWVHRKLQTIAGTEVLFSHRVVGLAQDGQGVTVTVHTPAGEKILNGRYLVGADGGRSTVRKLLGIGFEGHTYPERFLVMGTHQDFKLAIPDLCSVNYMADADEWCFLLQIPDIWRAVFPVYSGSDEEAVSDATIEARLQGVMPRREAYEVPVRALYKVHQRVADTYRKGRAFLAGDAAHLNNPLGGMGLNGGLHDAVDFADRLSRVWHGKAEENLLDGYEKKRKPLVVNAIMAQTARNKRLLEERDPQVRAQTLEQWRRMAADPKLAYEHLLQTSMIGPLRAAQAGAS